MLLRRLLPYLQRDNVDVNVARSVSTVYVTANHANLNVKDLSRSILQGGTSHMECLIESLAGSSLVSASWLERINPLQKIKHKSYFLIGLCLAFRFTYRRSFGTTSLSDRFADSEARVKAPALYRRRYR